GGGELASSSAPHSMDWPHKFKSYPQRMPPEDLGSIRRLDWAYLIRSSRFLYSHSRRGAMIFRLGASATMPASKRIWSVPFPEQPWATWVAPSSWATRTSSRAIRGRERAEARR